jgi:hypothetical protein
MKIIIVDLLSLVENGSYFDTSLFFFEEIGDFDGALPCTFVRIAREDRVERYNLELISILVISFTTEKI